MHDSRSAKGVRTPPSDHALTEIARLLDSLMAAPVKRAPAITVFGDDSVVGINPAPIRRDS